MVKFAIFILIALTIAILLAIVMLSVSMRASSQRNMTTPFECGFDPKNSARIPFSLHFFLLAVIFLIFDVEVALLLPILLIIKDGTIISLTALSLFLFILLIGLFHEWREGSLDWV